jgi:hypothetical protein
MTNLFIAGFDLFFFELDGLSQFNDESIFFFILVLKSLDLSLKLLDLQLINALNIV